MNSSLIMSVSKILTDLCLIRLKIEIRNIFVSVVYSVSVVKKYRLSMINRKQRVKLKSSSIRFKNYSKQIPVPFKIYADFECILKKVDCVIIECYSNMSYTRKYQDHIPCSFAYKVVCIDNKFSKNVVFNRGKNAVNKFIKSILSEYSYCRRVIKNILAKILSCQQREKKDFN